MGRRVDVPSFEGQVVGLEVEQRVSTRTEMMRRRRPSSMDFSDIPRGSSLLEMYLAVMMAETLMSRVYDQGGLPGTCHLYAAQT